MGYLPELQELHSKVHRLATTIGAGINNGYPPFDVYAKYSTAEANIDSRAYPVLKVREPRSNYTDDLTGTQYGLSKRDNDYLTAVDGVSWNYWDGNSWELIKTLTASADASQVNFLTYTILANGTDMVFWDGATTTGTVPTMPAVNLLTVHANRIYAASTADNVLRYTALSKWNDWTTADDSGDMEIDTEDGETASGLCTYADHVIYFKNRSCHELFGTGPINYTFQTLSDTIGCVAGRTIKEVQGMLFFLGEEGVYTYTGGVAPQLISYPYVSAYIDRMDMTNIAKACAGTDGDRYYLCLPIDSDKRIILTYDVRNRAWHVEDDFNCIEMLDFSGDLYAMGADGQIKKMIGDAGEEITWSWESKRFLNDYPSNIQSMRHMYVIATLPIGSTLTTSVKTEEGLYTAVKTFTPSADHQKQKIIMPLSVAHEADWFQIKFSGTGACKIHRFEMQIRIRRDSYLG